MEMLGRPLAWSAVEPLADSAPASMNLEETRPRPPRGARQATVTHDTRGSTQGWPAWLASEGEAITKGETVAKPAPVEPMAPPPPPFIIRPAFPEQPPVQGSLPAPAPDFRDGVRERERERERGDAASLKPPVKPPSATELRHATERGVAAASDAAAATARPKKSAPAQGRAEGATPAEAREAPREHVDLLWFDPAAVTRILADKALGEGRAEGSGAKWVTDAAAPRETQEAKDRREILAVLSRGRPVEEAAGMEQVAAAAYRDDGAFAASLILVAGDLSFDFDEVDTLEAMLSVTTPFLGADKKLKEVAGNASEVAKADGRLPGDIAAGFTRRIEEAFAQGQRSVAPGYLDTSVERLLLEGRRYPRRTLLGEPRLRALLALGGGSAPIPTYLPEALATRLPLFRRFRVRAVVELRPQEDQYETHPDALLDLALGRVLRR
jgi:hypothetical protein